LITAEEIHWRIHLNGWLPRGLRFARAYHMSHHDIPNTRYNVFLPLFDLLFGNSVRKSQPSDQPSSPTDQSIINSTLN
jgi:hypothetical protein